jgi:hypothetical protein
MATDLFVFIFFDTISVEPPFFGEQYPNAYVKVYVQFGTTTDTTEMSSKKYKPQI